MLFQKRQDYTQCLKRTEAQYHTIFNYHKVMKKDLILFMVQKQILTQ